MRNVIILFITLFFSTYGLFVSAFQTDYDILKSHGVNSEHSLQEFCAQTFQELENFVQKIENQATLTELNRWLISSNEASNLFATAKMDFNKPFKSDRELGNRAIEYFLDAERYEEARRVLDAPRSRIKAEANCYSKRIRKVEVVAFEGRLSDEVAKEIKESDYIFSYWGFVEKIMEEDIGFHNIRERLRQHEKEAKESRERLFGR